MKKRISLDPDLGLGFFSKVESKIMNTYFFHFGSSTQTRHLGCHLYKQILHQQIYQHKKLHIHI